MQPHKPERQVHVGRCPFEGTSQGWHLDLLLDQGHVQIADVALLPLLSDGSVSNGDQVTAFGTQAGLDHDENF